jgi:hypothetical protein
VDHYKAMASYPIKGLLAAQPEQSLPDSDDDAARDPEAELSIISDVIDWARERVAGIAGVDVNAVRPGNIDRCL